MPPVMPFWPVILVSARWLKPSGRMDEKVQMVQMGKQIKVWQRKLRQYHDNSCRERKAGLATYRIAEGGLIRKKSNKLWLFLVFCDSYSHMGLSLASRGCDDFTIWLHSRRRSEWLAHFQPCAAHSALIR
jgi:hypothetical protein